MTIVRRVLKENDVVLETFQFPCKTSSKIHHKFIVKIIVVYLLTTSNAINLSWYGMQRSLLEVSTRCCVLQRC